MINLLKGLLIVPTDKTRLQFLRYIFVGGFAFVVDFSVLYALTEHVQLQYLLSAGVAFTVGLLANFLLSRKFVFTSGGLQSRTLEFVAFGLIGVVGLGVNHAVMWLFTEHVGAHYLVSKIVSAVIVFSLNFFMRKYLLYGNGVKR